MNSSIEVILYDLGNVILPFNHYQIAEKLVRFSPETGTLDPKRIFSFLFDFEKGAVNRYETGEVSSHHFFYSLKDSFPSPLRNLFLSGMRSLSRIGRSPKRFSPRRENGDSAFSQIRILSTSIMSSRDFQSFMLLTTGSYPMRRDSRNLLSGFFKRRCNGLRSNRRRSCLLMT
jgi:hypothetical protein